MKIESMANGGTLQASQQRAQSQGIESQETESEVVKESSKQTLVEKKVENVDNADQFSLDDNQADNESEVIKAIEKANSHIRTYDRKLEFSIHESTKQIMVKVINTTDDSIIREIPSEKVLDMVAHMWEVAGILVDEKI